MDSIISFYSLFEKSPTPMWVFETTTLKFLDVNIAAVESYGYSKLEFLEMTIIEIRLEEDRVNFHELITKNLKSGKFSKNTYRHSKKNGEIISVEIESNPIDYIGVPAQIVLASNVTDKVIANERLANSEKRFKALVQEGLELIAILDVDLNYKYVSPISIRVLGMAPEDFLGLNVMQFIHEEDKSRVASEALKLSEHNQIQFSPFRIKHQSGEWRWVETKATNLLDDPAVQGIVCNSSDITERIVRQKEILENVERYNTVAKATQDAIWDYNICAETVNWNRGLRGILKYKNIGLATDPKWWEERIHPDDSVRVVKVVNNKINKGTRNWKIEYRFLCGDGIYRYILDRGYVSFDEDGVPSRMTGAMQDITAQKKYLQSIEEQNIKLKEIAWLQSHAVRGPLTKIMSLVSLLQDSKQTDESLLLLKYLTDSSLELDEAIIRISNNAVHR